MVGILRQNYRASNRHHISQVASLKQAPGGGIKCPTERDKKSKAAQTKKLIRHTCPGILLHLLPWLLGNVCYVLN